MLTCKDRPISLSCQYINIENNEIKGIQLWLRTRLVPIMKYSLCRNVYINPSGIVNMVFPKLSKYKSGSWISLCLGIRNSFSWNRLTYLLKFLWLESSSKQIHPISEELYISAISFWVCLELLIRYFVVLFLQGLN